VDWGAPGPLPDDGVVVRSDGEARQVVTAARRDGTPVPALGLLGGDLCRTLGGTGDEGRLRSGEAMTFPCDLGAVLLDGRLQWFVASLVARGPWWKGRAWLAMNAAWLGTWNVAPRAHPDDGLVDTFDAHIAPGQRLAVRRRLPLGAHLPHPGITERRAKAVQIRLDRPLPVWLDGTAVGEARDVSVRVEPDALTIVV
jgi:hypothetical protein